MLEVDMIAVLGPSATRSTRWATREFEGKNSEVDNFVRRVGARLGIELASATVLDQPTIGHLAEYLDGLVFGSDGPAKSGGTIDACLAEITANLPASTSDSQVAMVRAALVDLIDQACRAEPLQR